MGSKLSVPAALVSDRFVVEADRKVVGVAVRSPGGYKFFSSDRAFGRLDGRTFARARSLTNAVAKISGSQWHRAARQQPSPAF